MNEDSDLMGLPTPSEDKLRQFIESATNKALGLLGTAEYHLIDLGRKSDYDDHRAIHAHKRIADAYEAVQDARRLLAQPKQ